MAPVAAGDPAPGDPPDRDPVAGIAVAMREPDFYTHRPDRVDVVETHISWVFLAGERAYKLRKPVTLPFLDYGTRERRRAMCEEEVRLGRRLAPTLYLGTRAVVPDGDGYRLGGADEEPAGEHVVETRRFAAERTLEATLRRGEGTPDLARAIGRRIAQFHLALGPVDGAWGPAAVAQAVEENFHVRLEELSDDGHGRSGHRLAVAYLTANRDLLAARAGGGHVRECHGDLRAEHIVLDGGIEAFDPVEFDPRLREIDVSADLAFLLMDLERLGEGELAGELLEAYRSAGGDPGPDTLVWFYAAYRGWTRSKVALLRAVGPDVGDRIRRASRGEAAEYAALARRLGWRSRRPIAIAVCGGAATGKSSLARAVAELSDLAHLDSDVTRKELIGLPAGERAPAHAYEEEITRGTYRELGERAAREVAARGGVVVDATFRRAADRAVFAAGLGDAIRPVFVECRAPGSVIASRAAGRAVADPSDATPEIAAHHVAEFEPLDEVAADRHVVLRTDRTIEQSLDWLEAALDQRLSPAERSRTRAS